MEKVKNSSPFFVAIAGNIGVGKTTLTTKICEKFGWNAYFEKVINNPYLDDFYADMKRWSFNLQVFFLSKRFMDQRIICESPFPSVQDRSIYEDAEIFAYILHKQGNMTDRDYRNYRDLFYTMMHYLRKPDLVVYLKASTWTLISRIRKRGREFEKSINIDYLHELNEAYDRWIKNSQSELNVITLDGDILDFEKYPEQLDGIYEKIRRYYEDKIKTSI